jgi:hypothetical protein
LKKARPSDDVLRSYLESSAQFACTEDAPWPSSGRVLLAGENRLRVVRLQDEAELIIGALAQLEPSSHLRTLQFVVKTHFPVPGDSVRDAGASPERGLDGVEAACSSLLTSLHRCQEPTSPTLRRSLGDREDRVLVGLQLAGRLRRHRRSTGLGDLDQLVLARRQGFTWLAMSMVRPAPNADASTVGRPARGVEQRRRPAPP